MKTIYMKTINKNVINEINIIIYETDGTHFITINKHDSVYLNYSHTELYLNNKQYILKNRNVNINNVIIPELRNMKKMDLLYKYIKELNNFV